MSLIEINAAAGDWVHFVLTAAATAALIATVVVIVVTVLEDGITWPWQARRIRVWSAAVDAALELRRQQSAHEAAALAAGIDAALADTLRGEIEPAPARLRLVAPVDEAELVERS